MEVGEDPSAEVGNKTAEQTHDGASDYLYDDLQFNPPSDLADESNMSGLDLYTDMVVRDSEEAALSMAKLQEEKHSFKAQLDEALKEVSRLTKENEGLTKENHVLRSNVSVLLKTAKTELQRKDREISELRERKLGRLTAGLPHKSGNLEVSPRKPKGRRLPKYKQQRYPQQRQNGFDHSLGMNAPPTARTSLPRRTNSYPSSQDKSDSDSERKPNIRETVFVQRQRAKEKRRAQEQLKARDNAKPASNEPLPEARSTKPGDQGQESKNLCEPTLSKGENIECTDASVNKREQDMESVLKANNKTNDKDNIKDFAESKEVKHVQSTDSLTCNEGSTNLGQDKLADEEPKMNESKEMLQCRLSKPSIQSSTERPSRNESKEGSRSKEIFDDKSRTGRVLEVKQRTVDKQSKSRERVHTDTLSHSNVSDERRSSSSRSNKYSVRSTIQPISHRSSSTEKSTTDRYRSRTNKMTKSRSRERSSEERCTRSSSKEHYSTERSKRSRSKGRSSEERSTRSRSKEQSSNDKSRNMARQRSSTPKRESTDSSLKRSKDRRRRSREEDFNTKHERRQLVEKSQSRARDRMSSIAKDSIAKAKATLSKRRHSGDKDSIEHRHHYSSSNKANSLDGLTEWRRDGSRKRSRDERVAHDSKKRDRSRGKMDKADDGRKRKREEKAEFRDKQGDDNSVKKRRVGSHGDKGTEMSTAQKAICQGSQNDENQAYTFEEGHTVLACGTMEPIECTSSRVTVIHTSVSDVYDTTQEDVSIIAAVGNQDRVSASVESGDDSLEIRKTSAESKESGELSEGEIVSDDDVKKSSTSDERSSHQKRHRRSKKHKKRHGSHSESHHRHRSKSRSKTSSKTSRHVEPHNLKSTLRAEKDCAMKDLNVERPSPSKVEEREMKPIEDDGHVNTHQKITPSSDIATEHNSKEISMEVTDVEAKSVACAAEVAPENITSIAQNIVSNRGESNCDDHGDSDMNTESMIDKTSTDNATSEIKESISSQRNIKDADVKSEVVDGDLVQKSESLIRIKDDGASTEERNDISSANDSMPIKLSPEDQSQGCESNLNTEENQIEQSPTEKILPSASEYIPDGSQSEIDVSRGVLYEDLYLSSTMDDSCFSEPSCPRDKQTNFSDALQNVIVREGENAQEVDLNPCDPISSSSDQTTEDPNKDPEQDPSSELQLIPNNEQDNAIGQCKSVSSLQPDKADDNDVESNTEGTSIRDQFPVIGEKGETDPQGNIEPHSDLKTEEEAEVNISKESNEDFHQLSKTSSGDDGPQDVEMESEVRESQDEDEEQVPDRTLEQSELAKTDGQDFLNDHDAVSLMAEGDLECSILDSRPRVRKELDISAFEDVRNQSKAADRSETSLQLSCEWSNIDLYDCSTRTDFPSVIKTVPLPVTDDGCAMDMDYGSDAVDRADSRVEVRTCQEAQESTTFSDKLLTSKCKPPLAAASSLDTKANRPEQDTVEMRDTTLEDGEKVAPNSDSNKGHTLETNSSPDTMSLQNLEEIPAKLCPEEPKILHTEISPSSKESIPLKGNGAESMEEASGAEMSVNVSDIQDIGNNTVIEVDSESADAEESHVMNSDDGRLASDLESESIAMGSRDEALTAAGEQQTAGQSSKRIDSVIVISDDTSELDYEEEVDMDFEANLQDEAADSSDSCRSDSSSESTNNDNGDIFETISAVDDRQGDLEMCNQTSDEEQRGKQERNSQAELEISLEVSSECDDSSEHSSEDDVESCHDVTPEKSKKQSSSDEGDLHRELSGDIQRKQLQTDGEALPSSNILGHEQSGDEEEVHLDSKEVESKQAGETFKSADATTAEDKHVENDSRSVRDKSVESSKGDQKDVILNGHSEVGDQDISEGEIVSDSDEEQEMTKESSEKYEKRVNSDSKRHGHSHHHRSGNRMDRDSKRLQSRDHRSDDQHERRSKDLRDRRVHADHQQRDRHDTQRHSREEELKRKFLERKQKEVEDQRMERRRKDRMKRREEDERRPKPEEERRRKVETPAERKKRRDDNYRRQQEAKRKETHTREREDGRKEKLKLGESERKHDAHRNSRKLPSGGRKS